MDHADRPRGPRPSGERGGPRRPNNYEGNRRGGPPFAGRGNGPPRGPARGPRPDMRDPKRPEMPRPETVHRDRELVIAVKPEGVPVRGGNSAFTRAVNEHHAPRQTRLRAVHQIDDVASGVVAYMPKTEVDDLHDTRSSTTYLALVDGVFSTGDSEERVLTGPVEGLGDKPTSAVTSVRVIHTGENATLVRVRARPDAPGQVRTHLAAAGHPVIGDAEHGSLRDDLRRVALHAEEIRLRNPSAKMTERFRAPAPESFYRAVGAEPPAGSVDREARDARLKTARDQGWDPVAGWYDDLVSNRGSDHHQRTILPGVARMLALQPGESLLDIACGQGVLLDHLSQAGHDGPMTGVDLSPELIEHARAALGDRVDLRVADARDLGSTGLVGLDAASCVMALMNIDDLNATAQGIAGTLRAGGRMVCVVLHPAFRSPQATAWGWTNDGRTGVPIQFRRVDRYLSKRSAEIVMNPGAVASGNDAVTTTTYHRPISAYINAFAQAGLVIDAMEEWVSDRSSQAGPRANAENLSRAEIPMFLALRSVKIAQPLNDSVD